MIAGQDLERIVVTRSPAETRGLAAALAAAARPGDLISLVGELGAGKTQFAKGFGAGLGITDTIVSPSFVLMAEYRGRLPLFHVDLYRLADAAEALAGGLIDERQAEGVTVVEWAERLAEAMPEERLDVLIEGSGDEPRSITIRPGNADYSRYLDALPAQATHATAGRRGRAVTGRLLAIDTSGTSALVALGEADGALLAERRWVAGYRHGEELLARIDEALTTAGVAMADLGGIVVGTGPGAFTGLRVGLATAKALAHGLGIAIAGVPTSEALLRAASVVGEFEAARAVLLLPAGPSDRVAVVGGEARLLRGGEEPAVDPGATLVAVDLPGRAPEAAIALGTRAEAGLSAALLRLGAARLAAGGDDVAGLVPEYVSLPRGVPVLKGEVRWSHDHR